MYIYLYSQRNKPSKVLKLKLNNIISMKYFDKFSSGRNNTLIHNHNWLQL